MHLRSLAPALAAAAALSAPVSASAEQTATLTYKCKYPLIGVKPLSLKISLDVPESWPTGLPTRPFSVVAEASAFDMAAGLAAVDDLTSIKGTSTAFATVLTEQGFKVPAKTVATIPETKLPNPVPNPLVLTATGSTPALTFDDPGAEQIYLERLAINLTALDSAGNPIPLPPVTKIEEDGASVAVRDSDGDPNTFDVYCALDPATQSRKLGGFEITPVPTPTPVSPVADPTPTPVAGASSPTPKPTPSPTSSPTPSPGPSVFPLPAVPSGATKAPFQCKWPLLGVLGGDFHAAVLPRPKPEAPTTVGVWLKVPGGQFEGGEFDAYPEATKVRGVIKAELTGGGQSVTTQLSVLASSLSGSWGTTILYAEGVLPPSFAGTTVTVTKAAPNITVIDSVGQPVLLPPLTRDITGQPTTDSDGNPTTDDISCAPGTTPPTPAPSPTATSTPTPGPATATPTPNPPNPTPVPRPAPAPVTPGPRTITLTYGCKYPLIGVRPMKATFDIAAPATALAGAPRDVPVTGAFETTGLGRGLEAVDTEDFWEGQVVLDVATFAGDTASPQKTASLAFPRTAVPFGDAASEPRDGVLRVTASGTFPLNPVLGGSGDLNTSRLERLGFNLRATELDGSQVPLPPVTRDLDGNTVYDTDGDPNTFDVYCKLDPAGQDDVLGTTKAIAPPTPTPLPTPTGTTILTPAPPTPTGAPTPTPPSTQPTARYAYSLTGSTKLNTLTKGTMPLTGSVDASLVLSTGEVSADLRLNDTQGRLTALGFLPVTATVGFVTSGPTTGKLVDDQLTTTSKVRIKVKSVKAFGAIPLVSGNTCQTKSLSDITLTSTDAFDPTGTGGTLGGTYAISDLNGCGPLGGLVSPLTAGGGNTITVKLTPKP